MIRMKKFVFDTNILIDMKHYNPLVFKSLWENIYNMLEKNLIYSVPEVHDELYKADDSLNEKWERIDEKYGFFVDLTDKTNSREYIDAIKNNLLKSSRNTVRIKLIGQTPTLFQLQWLTEALL